MCRHQCPLGRSSRGSGRTGGGRTHDPTAKAFSPTLSEAGERQISFVFLSY